MPTHCRIRLLAQIGAFESRQVDPRRLLGDLGNVVAISRLTSCMLSIPLEHRVIPSNSSGYKNGHGHLRDTQCQYEPMVSSVVAI